MAPNLITLENLKPGNPSSDWELSSPESTSIQGFATRISVNRGSPVAFKINTACSNYRIEIYRLGFYAGLGARRVATRLQTAPSVQPPPLRTRSVGLVDCCNWAVTATWQVPEDAVSGVYIAKLTRQDGVAGESHIPFVVRDDGAKHDLVFQTADTTWQAYNGWGGANLYGGDAPESPEGRAYKVSYNRPFTTREGGGTFAGPQDFIFAAEFAAIRWFERNGFDLSYIAGVDTGPGNARLTDYRAFMSVGHDEYWSGEQRAHVEAARDAGVHLLFLSGNEMYWKTRWEPDGSGEPNRTLVTYKETKAGRKIDPSPEWTGIWRDPRFSPPSDGGRPENALSGTIYQVDSFRADTIAVPHPHARLRFWRNSAVAQTAPGQTATLAFGMLGYEWDESPDNGHRPQGLIHLSETKADVEKYLLDYGKTLGRATATHHLTLYRAASGAIVFGAGTVFWAFGLDMDHDYCSDAPEDLPPTPEDPSAQQLMINILADMGIQPDTLQTDLVAAGPSDDTDPPVTSILAPTADDRLEQYVPIVISGTSTDAKGRIAVVEVSVDGGTTWHPAIGREDWSYIWLPLHPGGHEIRARAVDDSLNMENACPTLSVNVAASRCISLFRREQVPALVTSDDGRPAEVGVRFKTSISGHLRGIMFYKGPINRPPHVARLWSAQGVLIASTRFDTETHSGWQIARFFRPVPISAGSLYLASCYAPNGHYSADDAFFAAPHVRGALTATAGSLRHQSWRSRLRPNRSRTKNYWVDVLFEEDAV